jgi:hypothetical protein
MYYINDECIQASIESTSSKLSEVIRLLQTIPTATMLGLGIIGRHELQV